MVLEGLLSERMMMMMMNEFPWYKIGRYDYLIGNSGQVQLIKCTKYNLGFRLIFRILPIKKGG